MKTNLENIIDIENKGYKNSSRFKKLKNSFIAILTSLTFMFSSYQISCTSFDFKKSLQLSRADEYILKHLFYGSPDLHPDFGLPWVASPAFPYLGEQPPFEKRWQDISEAFVDLVKKDDKAIQLYKKGNIVLVEKLGLRPTSYTLRIKAYEVFKKNGLLAMTLKRANELSNNKETTFLVPKGYALMDPMWDKDEPGIRASGVVPSDTPCGLIFRYCSGGVVISNIGKGEVSDCFRTHLQLLEADAKYKMKFEEAIFPFIKQAYLIDPASTQEITRFNYDLQEALMKSGIFERIQEKVRISTGLSKAVKDYP